MFTWEQANTIIATRQWEGRWVTKFTRGQDTNRVTTVHGSSYHTVRENMR